MGINGQVGEIAGKLWHALSIAGPLTLAQLKKRLNGSSELTGFALGWLAREDKVEIIPDKRSFRVNRTKPSRAPRTRATKALREPRG